MGNYQVITGLALFFTHHPTILGKGVMVKMKPRGGHGVVSTTINMYAIGWSGVIKTRDAGSLERLIRRGDSGFGEDGHCCAGKDM